MQHLFGYMESLCRTKEIRLQMNTVSLPQMLKFDRVLIERAIMNVISNGLDYSPQGGTLYVDIQSNNSFVEISVTDEGTGFSKEHYATHRNGSIWRSKPQFKVTLWYGSIYYKFDYGTT